MRTKSQNRPCVLLWAKQRQASLTEGLRFLHPAPIKSLERFDGFCVVVLHSLENNETAVNVLDAVLLDLKQMPNAQGLDFVLDQELGGFLEAF